MNFLKTISQKSSHSIVNLSERMILILVMILALPAFLLNLGDLPIIGDEGIRNLVALEMKLSGNFIVPTLNGELYLNKPPLFNWLIYLSSEILGQYGVWPSRILNLLFLGIYAITVYYAYSKNQAFASPLLLALMLLTSGRILFWDSMYGLIDICFSWIVFLNFMVLFHFGTLRKWKSFFGLSYVLCALAFMLKGLPALVFQAISIISALIYFKEFRKQFVSWNHILCGVAGLLPVISYYLVYTSYVPLEKIMAVLTDQSLRRTATHHGIFKTVIHFFTFPFEQFYHFLPWSILTVLFFTKKFWTWVKQHNFVWFNFILLLANLPVYWLSVEVYPRYLLMFIPLFNVLFVYFYHNWQESEPRISKSIHRIFLIIALILTIVSISLPLINPLKQISGILPIAIGSAFILGWLCFFIWKYERQWMVWFALFMLAARIVFDLTVLPVRSDSGNSFTCREDARRIYEQHKDLNWYIFDSTEMHQVSRYYMTMHYQKIITRKIKADDPKGMYLVDPEKYPEFSGMKLDSLFVETGKYLNLMKLDN